MRSVAIPSLNHVNGVMPSAVLAFPSVFAANKVVTMSGWRFRNAWNSAEIITQHHPI
jgi:hypothetical protein